MDILEKKEGVEFLRICMMLLIVFLHISGRFPADISDPLTYSLYHFFRSFAFVSVSGFAFISGYFGINWKLIKFVRMEFVAITMGLLLVCIKFVVFSEFCIRDLFCALTPIMSRNCWYFSAYMLLMLLAPFLNNEIVFKNSRLLKVIILLLSIFVYIGVFLYKHDGTTVVYLIMVYLLGRYFFFYTIEFLKKNVCLIGGGALLFNGAIALLCVYGNIPDNVFSRFCNNHNPLLIIAAISLFFVAFKIKTNIHYSRLSKYMLSVYLAHGIALHMNLIPLNFLQSIPFFPKILIYVVVVFSASIFCEIVRNKIFSLFEERVMKIVCKNGT
ncbi:acyltransferase family protein [Fibrobacter sp. UWB11]|uniref:acyltransferase family protein n=1 Tax=Fibrobacter sp. UWB11 TaxID=1896202 RepID=UPI000926A825|nr:acyltransferase family protein [Fibrobacter sp. UWB11]SIO10370.1 Acyltransferase family protein [Fibrobacter sp. UWB11]